MTSALRISPAWSDPDAVMAVVRGAGPFWPLANYAASDAEMAAFHPRKADFGVVLIFQDPARWRSEWKRLRPLCGKHAMLFSMKYTVAWPGVFRRIRRASASSWTALAA